MLTAAALRSGSDGPCQDKSSGARQNAGALPPRRERARARHAPAPLAEPPSAVADRAETGRRASAVDEEVKRPRQQDELAGQIVGRQARSSSAPSVLAKRSQRAMVADGSPIGVYYRAITEAGWNFRAITLGWSGIWGLEPSPRPMEGIFEPSPRLMEGSLSPSPRRRMLYAASRRPSVLGGQATRKVIVCPRRCLSASVAFGAGASERPQVPRASGL